MARIVRDREAREEKAAVCKLERFQRNTLWSPVNEVVNPTTPAKRDRITKKPVAMLPIGKYIGNIRAGIDSTEAVKCTQNNPQVIHASSQKN